MKSINDFKNRLFCGDCIEVMKEIPDQSIDLIVTDPPYLVNYKSSDGRGYKNDDPFNAKWLKPAYAEMYRVLKPDSFCVSFYGYTQVEKFMIAWKSARFRPLNDLIFQKKYASSTGHVRRYHEQAYLLGKGRPVEPNIILPSILKWRYTGNKLHPTQKPVMSIEPLIKAFSDEGDIVLDPFAGSGTTLITAKMLGRNFIGIEIDKKYYQIAGDRIKNQAYEKV